MRIAGPTIETQDVRVLTRAGKESLQAPGYRGEVGNPLTFRSTGFDHAAAPATEIVGVVRDRDTRKPIPGAIVTSYQRARDPISHVTDLRATADKDGRFRLTGMPRGDGNVIMAQPPADLVYTCRTNSCGIAVARQ